METYDWKLKVLNQKLLIIKNIPTSIMQCRTMWGAEYKIGKTFGMILFLFFNFLVLFLNSLILFFAVAFLFGIFLTLQQIIGAIILIWIIKSGGLKLDVSEDAD